MKLSTPRPAVFLPKFHVVTALVCAASLVSPAALFSQEPAAPAQSQVLTNAPAAADSAAAPAEAAPKIPNDQLDSLVSPIALYPDPLLAQTLAASTYPLEVIQLEQWMKKNKSLKGKALTTAVEGQKWDPSVQSMAALPDVVKQLSENISWTTDLGNAFLAQQSDVMDAVQRMRAKAQGAGNLKSSKEQKVESKTVESKQVIVIEQADPEVVYVPTYNPTVVYGASAYPYPSMYYPPGYGMLAFGAGVAIGAAWGNGGWGYGCGWGGNNDITINNNNNFVNHYNKNNVNNGNRPNGGQGNGKWQHSAQHRGGAPYGDRGTANKYGGNARQQPAGGNRPGGGAGAGAGNRPGSGGGAGNRPGAGGGAGNIGAGNRPGGGAGAGNRPGGGAGAATRPSSGGAGLGGGGGNRASTMPSGGGANRVGNQNLGGGGGGGSRGGGGASPSFSSSSGGGGFGGGGGGGSARASSSRGGSSMGGGGMSRGGGGGGGGGRGGGGGGGRRR